MERFKKYIVKQIVKSVGFNPHTLRYDINRTQYTNEIDQRIKREGERYGYDSRQINELVRVVAKDIELTPSKERYYNIDDIGQIDTGQHMRVNITHAEKGEHFVEMVKLSGYRFFLVDDNISGLRYGDILKAQDKTWNYRYYTDFTVWRDGKRFPDGKSVLRLGEIKNIEFFFPSVVHEIMDSTSNFTLAEAEQTIEDVIQTSKYFTAEPVSVKNAIRFRWDEREPQDEKALFVIEEDESEPDTKILINENYVIPSDSKQLKRTVQIVQYCCKTKNGFDPLRTLKRIKMAKEGVLKTNKSESHVKEWVLLKPLQIKFIYEE